MSNNTHRTGSTEATQILQSDALREANAAAAEAETDDWANQRAQDRAARDRALGKVPTSSAPDPVLPAVHKPTTEKFFPSLGLFLLRLVTAGIMGVHGFQKLTDITGTEGFMSSLGLPSPYYMAWGIGIAELLAAVALVFGLLTRVAGLGIAALSIGALAMVQWGAGNPFQSGKAGFVGELELLLAAVGLTLLFVGPGRWSIDGQIRANRRKNKARY